MLTQKITKLRILRAQQGKMNRFRLALGRESDFEELWLSRDSHLKGVPGVSIAQTCFQAIAAVVYRQSEARVQQAIGHRHAHFPN